MSSTWQHFRSKNGNALFMFLGIILTAGFYLWTATSAGSPFTAQLQKEDLYNRLADGILAGRTSFLEEPNPELLQLSDPWDPAQNGGLSKFHDVSYFKGRYYLYFGPTPLLLLVPWKAITGTYLAQNVAVAVFALIGSWAGMALMLRLREHFFPSLPRWIGWAAAVPAAWGNMVPVLLRRPVVYELAIVAGYSCVMIALYALVRALQDDRTRDRWLAAAGLAYGLAIAARPNLLFGAAMFGVVFWPAWAEWRARRIFEWPLWRARVLAVAVPLGAVVAGVLVYNWARFDNPFEFGTSYMMAGMHPQRDVHSGPGFLPVNLYYYLLAPANFSPYFPFIQVTGILPFTAPQYYTGVENAYGILATMPWVWIGVALWWARSRLAADLRRVIAAVGLLAAGNFLFVGMVAGAANRYMVDFLPPLVVMAGVGVMVSEGRWSGWRRLAFRAGWIGALAALVFFNVCVSLQHNELLRHHNFATYDRLARFGNELTWPVQRALGGGETGPLRLTLRLPAGKTGKLEPLVVTGASFRADFLWIYYHDDGRVVLGFEHTSYGGPKTDPIAVDYSKPQVVEVEMGSLYPPKGHPFFDGFSPAEVDRRKRTLRVTLNGAEALRGEIDFYEAAPWQVSVGKNHVSDAFGRRFTGTVQKVKRGGAR